ncbi:MAG TPA: WYL domain-containing protein [Gemmatimonadales bacterium]|nr:WYL domain-containing protein [Gemmatimonadales bacterium]
MASKLQRWVDLLAALLRHRYAVSLEELRRDVPGYQAMEHESMRRKFERDKKELREFGIPIETIGEDEGGGYRLRTRDFYLPYLQLVDEERGHTEPSRLQGDPWRQLALLQFTSDELRVVAEAAARVVALGDDALASDARTALRKLAVDLPMDGAASTVEHVHGAEQHDAATLALLGSAVQARKQISCSYHSIGSDVRSERTLEPLGLFFLSRAWYLAAREPGEELVKNFRVSRMADLTINTGRVTPDFERPAGWSLQRHARARSSWELGDDDLFDVDVRIVGDTGATAAAARLGTPVEGSPDILRYPVRRIDAFVRWLLPLGDAVEPIAPEPVVTEWRRLAGATLALYQEVS